MSGLLNSKIGPIKNIKPAKRYAKALLELSDKSAVYEELKFVVETVLENDELKNFLFSPVVFAADKNDVLNNLFSKRITPEAMNFLLVLNDEGRLNIIEDILSAFDSYINEDMNILKAFVTSAIELDEAQKANLVSKLENKTGKKIEPHYETDGSILGGIIVKINDTVIDLSIRKKIENLRK